MAVFWVLASLLTPPALPCCAMLHYAVPCVLCALYRRDDVSDARSNPGNFPNIDLLHRVYNEGLELEFVVDEVNLK